MSGDIKVGDLVMVIRPIPCCLRNDSGGKIFVVAEIRPVGCPWCPACNAHRPELHAISKDREFRIMLSRLRRIDPIAEPETTQEEATA